MGAGPLACWRQGSIGITNVYEGSGGRRGEREAADAGAPAIADLRAAAESGGGDNAGPWSDLAFAHFQRGEFTEAATALSPRRRNRAG